MTSDELRDGLQGLLRQWRNQPERADDDPRSWENLGKSDCADELEALLNA